MMKNSHEQWKYDFHRTSVFGGDEARTVVQHDVPVAEMSFSAK